MRIRRHFGTLLVALFLVTIAGCASPGRPQTVPTPIATTALSASPTAAASAAPTATGPTPEPTYLVPPPPANVTVVPGQYLADTASTNMTYRVEIPSADAGPREYAQGTTIMEGDRVVAYRVATGDLYDFICERFGLSNDGYILAINQIRRGGNAELYAGDVLNLSPYTMRKYGSVNGAVLANPDPTPMPPQER